MTIPELIASVLAGIRAQFYADRVREFKRDERALTKAIARWGYVCEQRGWLFDEGFILKNLMELLMSIKRSGAEVKYLPSYLESAVGRWIGQRAEELSAKAKSTPLNVTRVIAGVQRVVVIEKTPTEVLAAVYKDLARQKRAQRITRAPARKAQQKEMDLL